MNATPGPPLAAKVALRDQVRASRRRRPLAEAAEDAAAIAAHLLAAPDVRRAATVAAYVGVGPEPGTGLLLDALTDAGKRVILPVVMPDLDLDWAAYTGSAGLAPAGRGLLEPASERLGLDAIATADVVLLPGLAVSSTGMRLGRGGGCYDWVLARVPVGTFTCVVLYDDEVGREVPTEPHDRRVAAAVSPAGIVTF
ncbi:5-formyltetrahydrofolate cyclo-ligase [Nocardioides sp. InS609-2]|uniref:5-formyltetrahydrofolate cyclo-ligase n=1 Tax=Nocardioides sp. InS609-2 TaxID=2760705 RepID=UPI0020BEE093|nr:5-formyltetrahydrofolate cyclo-ligase [Nocardioides sp. InS609-2]